jgi:hypothetical protein
MKRHRSEKTERFILRQRLHDRYPNNYEIVEAVVSMFRGKYRDETERLFRGAKTDEFIEYLRAHMDQSGIDDLILYAQHFWNDHQTNGGTITIPENHHNKRKTHQIAMVSFP